MARNSKHCFKKKVRAVKQQKALPVQITSKHLVPSVKTHTPAHPLTHSKRHREGRMQDQEIFNHGHWIQFNTECLRLLTLLR